MAVTRDGNRVKIEHNDDVFYYQAIASQDGAIASGSFLDADGQQIQDRSRLNEALQENSTDYSSMVAEIVTQPAADITMKDGYVEAVYNEQTFHIDRDSNGTIRYNNEDGAKIEWDDIAPQTLIAVGLASGFQQAFDNLSPEPTPEPTPQYNLTEDTRVSAAQQLLIAARAGGYPPLATIADNRVTSDDGQAGPKTLGMVQAVATATGYDGTITASNPDSMVNAVEAAEDNPAFM